MQSYIAQAESNFRLLCHLEKDHPAEFDDWKTTIIFYIIVHAMKAYCDRNKITDTGDSHIQTFDSMRTGRLKGLKQHVKDDYSALFRYSRRARYEGIHDPQRFSIICRSDYTDARKRMGGLLGYFEGRGVPIRQAC